MVVARLGVAGSFGEPSGGAVLLLGSLLGRAVHFEATEMLAVEAFPTFADEAAAPVGVNHQGGRQLLAGQKPEIPRNADRCLRLHQILPKRPLRALRIR
ncbi:MAG: hypothetical protein QG633_312 [Patescibacteria group bacterium]|nr:hypothetical protein [Patescibacteria group bacterium]